MVSEWPAASPITYGQTLADSVLTGGLSTPSGSFAFTAPETVPPLGTSSQSVTFVPGDSSNFNGSTGWIDVVAVAPEIVVEQPPGTPLVNGSSILSCGSADLGSPAMGVVITIRNAGTADLTGLAVGRAGNDSNDFAIGPLGTTSLAPGASTTFDIVFTPLATGDRATTVRIASNDSAGNPFGFIVSGYGRTPIESWRFAHFGTESGEGNAANHADSDFDTIPNLIEYAMGLEPTMSDPSPVTAARAPDSISLIYPRNLAATDVNIIYEESTETGVTDSWKAVILHEEYVTTEVNGVRMIKATCNLAPGESRKFLRIRVDTSP